MKTLIAIIAIFALASAKWDHTDCTVKEFQDCCGGEITPFCTADLI